MSDFNRELTDAADEAIFGLQLNREQAVQFVLNNVGRRFMISRTQAEKEVEKVIRGE